MLHRQVVHAVYIERAGEKHIGDLSDLAGVAVFDRKHRAVALAAHDGIVCVAEVAVSDPFSV